MSLPKFVMIAACCLSTAAAADSLYSSFKDPAMETRPFVRWWWNGGRVDAQELVRELDVMKAAGIGGVEINTIGMPEGATPQSLAAHPAIDWLSPQWADLVRQTVQAARERGMTPDLIVGSGWPFGGRFLAPEEQTQRVFLTKRAIKGPTQLQLTRAEAMDVTHAVFPEKATESLPTPTLSELLFLRLVPNASLAGEFSPGRDLPRAFDSSGKLTVDVPAGDFTLYVGAYLTGFTHVKLGAPGADGPVVDHFSARAVRKYLDHMSDQLAPHLGGDLGPALRAMFIDSLELDRANWTADLPQEFARRRGYALAPYLPFVLDLDDPKATSAFNATVRRARYDFDATLLELFDERFLATYVSWAAAHHVKARIQAYGRETHPLHGSMKVHLPEGESWLWLDKLHPDRIRIESTVANRYVASAANLTGQRLRSFEAMTNAVPVFRETLQDFKRTFDATIVAGLNHPIIHGFNYTPPDAGFPGWVRFGSYLNERNPWWPHFRKFADYAARIGTVMRASDAPTRIGIIAPRPDEWARHGLLYQPFPEVAEPWYQYLMSDAFQQAGYNNDFLSEEILAQADVTGGRLRFGHGDYELLVLQDVRSMNPAAARALARYVAEGGRVVFIGALPSQAPGLDRAQEQDQAVTAALSAIRAAAADQVLMLPAPTQAPHATVAQDQETVLRYSVDLLARTGLPADVSFEQPQTIVSQLSKRDGERRIYFLSNSDADRVAAVNARFPGAKGRPYRWNAETGERVPLTLVTGDRLQLRLEPTESALIVFEPNETAATGPARLTETKEEQRLVLKEPWKVDLAPAASARTVQRELPTLLSFHRSTDAELKAFGGVATYTIEFDAKIAGPALLDLGEVHNLSEVTLNGISLGTRWWGRHRYETKGALKAGRNQLQVKVTTMLVNLMQHKRDDAMAQRWAGWEAGLPAGLVGPVRILEVSPGRQ